MPQTHPHRYTHICTTRTPGCVCVVTSNISTSLYTHSTLKHTLQTHANPCVHSLQDWNAYTHSSQTHTHGDRCTCTLLHFRAAPVTFPSTHVHSQLLLLDLKMWGTWWSVSLSTFPINIPFRGWQHLVTFLLQNSIKGAWLPPVWGYNDVSRNFSLAPALGPCSRDKKSLYGCVWGGEVWTWGCR